jgi:hypothetical protein
MDAADIGWLENRGWKDLEPGKAAQEAIKAYRSAESRLGIPADQVVRWPKDATDAENWATVRERLGVPKEASEYDFSSVKKPDGGDLDAAFQDWARATASGLALPKDVAPKLAAEVVKFNATKAAEDAAAAQAAQVEQEAKLRADWSTNYDANLFVAKGAAQALGIGPEVVDALARAGVGYADTLEMFRKIGAQIGEDKFVRPLNPNASGVKTRDGAVAELAELKTDEAAVKRYLSGDQAEVRKWNALHVIIAGDDVEESRRRAMR